MRKRLIAILLCVVIIATFTGCSLFTVNSDRESNQALATIGKGATQQKVTMGELMSYYNSYGYLYVYYYGMSVSDVCNSLLNSLVTSKLELVVALNELPKVGNGTGYKAYFTADELAKVKADVDKAISAEIDKYEVEIIKELNNITTTDSSTSSIRTTPTGADTSTVVPIDFAETDTRIAAIAKLKRTLVANGNTYDKYYADVEESYLESALVAKYKEVLFKDVTISDADVQARYDTILAEEAENYKISTTAYASKVKNLSAGNYVISAPVGGYGMVYDILIAFSDEQNAILDQMKTDKKSDEEIEAKRQELLKEIRAYDLRTDWLKEYGYNKNEGGLFADLDFDGVVTPVTIDGVQTRGDDGKFAYSEITPNKYTIDEFMAKLAAVMQSQKGASVDGFDINYSDPAKKSDYMNMIWAYASANGGMLNNTVGLYSAPVPGEGEKETYVQNFADAARAVVKAGEGAYTVVDSEYGYHIILCVDSFQNAGIVNALNVAEKNTVGTFTYEFYQTVETSLKNNYYSQTANALVSSYMEDDSFIKYNDTLYAKMLASISA